MASSQQDAIPPPSDIRRSQGGRGYEDRCHSTSGIASRRSDWRDSLVCSPDYAVPRHVGLVLMGGRRLPRTHRRNSSSRRRNLGYAENKKQPPVSGTFPDWPTTDFRSGRAWLPGCRAGWAGFEPDVLPRGRRGLSRLVSRTAWSAGGCCLTTPRPTARNSAPSIAAARARLAGLPATHRAPTPTTATARRRRGPRRPASRRPASAIVDAAGNAPGARPRLRSAAGAPRPASGRRRRAARWPDSITRIGSRSAGRAPNTGTCRR